MEVVSGPPTAFPFGHWCTVGVLAGTHRCATESRTTLGQCANPLCACWSCWSRVITCSLRSRFTCLVLAPLQRKILTPLLDWERCRSSESSSFFNHSYHFQDSLPNFCGLWVFSLTRHLVRDLIELFLLVACCNVASQSICSRECNSVLSRKNDQLRKILSVFESYCNLRDGRHAVHRVSSVPIIFNCK